MVESRPEDFTSVLYKYTDLNGAQQILANRTLRFALASSMNDPFDVRIDEWLGMEDKEFIEAALPLLVEKLLGDPKLLATRLARKFKIPHEQAKAITRRFPESRKGVLKSQISTLFDDADYERRVRESLDEARNGFVAEFGSSGIFCATRTYQNLLMWAHYTNGHRGAVFGFCPDLAKDSILRLMKPVNYTDKRPHAIDSAEEWVSTFGEPAVEKVRKIVDKLLHTKSAEWSYEQELRLTMPYGVKAGESAGFYFFHPGELKELYLGYRMNHDNKAEIVRVAKALNPDVQIFAARLAKRKYELEFDPVRQ